jgi:FKBP-type peptidyl-prolyl cis-trans isomerase FklB
MKSIQTLAVLLLLPALGHAQEQLPSQYKTNKEKASYAVGVNVALDLQRAGFDMNLVIKGLQEVMAGRQAALDEQQRREAIVAFTQEQAQLLSDKNKKEGAALMTAFKKEEGVRSLPSGVLYKILKNGNGKSPKANDRVTVHYKGTLPDNRQFDSSYDRGAPTSFGVQDAGVATDESRRQVESRRAAGVGLWRARFWADDRPKCHAHVRDRTARRGAIGERRSRRRARGQAIVSNPLECGTSFLLFASVFEPSRKAVIECHTLK